jgi:diguanylate cyclase (GGDEF)-like protein
MARARSHRDLWASLLPVAGGCLALAVAYQFPALAPAPLHPALLLLFLFAGAAGACHRPLPGATPPGLGAMVLPPALLLAGAAPAAFLAAAVLLVAELALRLARRAAGFQPPDRRSLLRALEGAGRTALAALAAGLLWTRLRVSAPAAALPAAAALYLFFWAGLEAADRKLRRPEAPLRPAPLLPLALDAVAWGIGGALVAAGAAAGWGVTGALLAALALLALEAARGDLLRERAQKRVRDLERLRRAGKRMFSSTQEMASIADRIRIECAKVVPFSWMQFEALAPGSEFKSWWAGPQGVLREGVPEPDRYPPALPGVHRRSSWTLLERPIRAEGKVLGRLRLWCDPRRLEPNAVDLLDRLLPQMTVSIQRCLLDREAREDLLTGVAVRRVLEKRLHEMHARCCEDGGTMAVVLCDLDHFKRINDTYGHPAGDAALVAVAGLLKEIRRPEDLCCRYGGEEFVLLLEKTGGDAALATAERLRHGVEALDFRVEGERVPLTLSAGVAAFPELYIKTAAELILFADEALYEAKRRGRNRCLLDIGQGRYQDVDGVVHVTDEAQPAQEPPRIFA